MRKSPSLSSGDSSHLPMARIGPDSQEIAKNLAGKLHKCGCDIAQIHALVRLIEEFVWSNGVDIET